MSWERSGVPDGLRNTADDDAPAPLKRGEQKSVRAAIAAYARRRMDSGEMRPGRPRTQRERQAILAARQKG